MASMTDLRFRKTLSIAGSALLVLTLFAKGTASAATAPGVDWRRSDWFPVHPTNGPQAQAASGEDWWYDHDNSYDGSRALQGHIAAGYSSFVNWTASELPFGGCVVSQPAAPDLCHFESPGNVRGDVATTMALIDPTGTTRFWIKKYALGFFFRVIQTRDGGYLATGTSPSTRDFSGQPIYYNPGQTPGKVTDSFDLGNGCPLTGGDARYRVVVVKTDALGNVQWQYSYGMQPYRDGNGVPQPAAAYEATGLGYDVLETPSGNFLIVGDTIDPQNTFVCGGTNPHRLSRGFLIEVTPAGHWVSGQFFGPTNAPSTVAAITRVSTTGGDRYVLASNELFPTANFNGYTGCNLFQKVVVRAVGPTPAHPLLWQQTDFDLPIPANATTSQRTDGVEVSSSGEILLPLIGQCTGCLYSGYNAGTGKVFRLDSSGQTVGSSVVGPVTAFDLKLDVTPTPDGGFATISTRHTTPPPAPYNCYDTRYWNTDAFVSKFDAAGTAEWSTTFDSPNVQASYPGDAKKQECLYSISQSSDGGFVVAGNDSSNFDDDYLAKLDPAPLPPGPALTIRDTPVDSGLEPNPDTGPMWISDDIWVRNQPDQGLTHESPQYSPSQPFNYIRVRVTNLGDTPASGTLRVYWAKASTGLGWQTQWINYFVNGVLWGDELAGTVPINNLAPGASTVITMPWQVPNPADFVSFGADKGHFCLLARIEPAAGMTYPEGSSVFQNTKNNRAIAWKNVTVVEGAMKQGVVVVRNISRRPARIRLAFGASRALDRRLVTFLNYGTIDISLDRELLDRWIAGGRVGRGVTLMRDGRIRVTAPNAWIGGFRMGPGEMKAISAEFALKRPSPAVELRFDILQYSTVLGRESLVGGQRFAIPTTSPCTLDPGLNQAGNTFARHAILAQTFKPLRSGALTEVVHGLRKAASSASSYNLYITTTTNGKPSWPAGVLYTAKGLTSFASGTGIDGAVPVAGGLQLSSAETYALILEPVGPGDMYWRGNSGAGTYPRGAAYEWNPVTQSWRLTTTGPRDHGFRLDGSCR